MDRLPNEILLEIFVNLDLWDLSLHVPQVCRLWRSLINDSGTISTALDQILFRDKLREGGQIADSYRMHPILRKVSYPLHVLSHPMVGCLFCDRDGDLKIESQENIRELIKHANPISPSLSSFIIRVQDGFESWRSVVKVHKITGKQDGDPATFKQLVVALGEELTTRQRLHPNTRGCLELEGVRVVDGEVWADYEYM